MIIALAGQIPVTNTRKTPSKEVRDPSGTPPKNIVDFEGKTTIFKNAVGFSNWSSTISENVLHVVFLINEVRYSWHLPSMVFMINPTIYLWNFRKQFPIEFFFVLCTGEIFLFSCVGFFFVKDEISNKIVYKMVQTGAQLFSPVSK